MEESMLLTQLCNEWTPHYKETIGRLYEKFER